MKILKILFYKLFRLEKYIDRREDSIYVYEVKNPKNISKSVYGQEKSFDEMFL